MSLACQLSPWVLLSGGGCSACACPGKWPAGFLPGSVPCRVALSCARVVAHRGKVSGRAAAVLARVSLRRRRCRVGLCRVTPIRARDALSYTDTVYGGG